jgi:nephrocystin-3
MSAGGKASDERSVRVFISSTFRDMQAERDVLARETFPALRARFRLRGVELLDLDLRWGITEEQSQRGETLTVCLDEIDRCRPFFIGVLGERYGWVPPPEALTPELKKAFPVLNSVSGRSVTEIEMLHGALRDPSSARVLFFERDPAWIEKQPADKRGGFLEGGEARSKLNELKARIRKSAKLERYTDPKDLGDKLGKALERMLDAIFPEQQAPDAFTLLGRMHAAFARERCGFYVGGEPYFSKLDAWASRDGAPPLLVTGASGSGKSALVSNWLARLNTPFVFEHFLGASPESAEPIPLLRRLWEYLRRIENEPIPAPADEQALMDSLPVRLQNAAARAARDRKTLVIALDGLDKLASGDDLRWLPAALPPNVRLLLSSITPPPGAAPNWAFLEVKPLSDGQRRDFVTRSLQRMHKGLSNDRIARIIGHTLASAPLFLKTLLQELRVATIHEQLDARINLYLSSRSLPELFARLLERLEQDFGAANVRTAASLIWASRAGLEEAEIIAIAKVPPSTWSAVRHGLGETLRDQDGRMAFDHDFIRQACAERYLKTPDEQRRVRLQLAAHMEALPPNPRQAEELSFQYLEAQDWTRLEQLLTDLARFDFLHARGDVELLRYWLALRGQGRDIEQSLTRAAAQLPAPEQWSDEQIYRVGRICDFLEFAGARGDGTLRLRQQLITALTRTLGPDAYNSLRAQASFGQLLFKRAEYREARQVLERVVAAQTRVLGANDADTMVSMIHLGDVLHAMGDHTAAKTVLETAVAGLTRSGGAEHPHTLGAILNLAETYRAIGDLRRTQDIQSRVLDVRKRTLGAEHPDTLIAMHGLAGTLAEAGDCQGALAMQRRVVEIRTRVLGPDNPSTIASMHNLAVTLGDTGDLQRARDLFEQVVKRQAQALGATHPNAIATRTSLANMLLRLGDLKGARAALEQCVGDLTRALGAEHPSTLSAIASQCAVLRAGGDAAGAMERMRRVVEISTSKLGPDNPDTLWHMNTLGVLMLECENAAGAMGLLKRVADARERSVGPDHPSTLSTWNSIASARARLGDLEGACKIEERVIEAYTRTLGREHVDTLNSMNNLATNLQRLGQGARARQLLEEVLAARSRTLGPNHPDTLTATNNIGTAMSSVGDYTGARKMFERAADGLAGALGENHPRALESSNNLASTLFKLDDFAGAKRLSERVLAARIKVLGPTHPDTNLTRQNLVVIENRLRER